MAFFTKALLMALIWGAISGSFSVANLLLGFVVGAVALRLVRGQEISFGLRVRPIKVLILTLSFLYELVMSAVRVAILVLSPRMELRPGIFAYRLRVNTDFEIALLANLITLTPGTLSVDVSADRRTLFIHTIDCSDRQKLRQDIANGFERQIMEAFR